MSFWVWDPLTQFFIQQKMNAENSEALFPLFSLSLSLSSQLKRWRRWDFSFFLLHARLINEFAPKWPLTLTLLRLARMPAIIPDRLFLRSSCACHCPLAIRDPPAAPGFVGEKMKGNFCFSALQNEANGRVWLRK